MLPDAQHFMRPGIIEFTWGHPDLALFPTEALARAATFALSHDDRAELCYGAVQGPGSLIRQLCAWLGQAEGRAIPQERIFIAGGLSQGLDLLCTLYTRPGDALLVDSPTYHLALRVFRDRGLELIPVAGDADGLRPEALADALARLHREHREHRQARFLYLVPNFGNPTGATLPLVRRQAIAALAQEVGLTILEDDVYRHLWFDAPPPPPLSDLAPDHVIRLGSFSKLLAPGLRVGWLHAPPTVVRRCAGSGLLDSGGGASHFAAHVVAAFMEQGGFDAHGKMLRAAYRARRDILCAALARHLPDGCQWQAPGGGFFVWVRLPEGIDSVDLLPRAEAAGVSFVPGVRFCAD
ncbi:MAG: PLP-dependent aminotransferase family protein, partial [Anaerolineae bacterium]|nr:PLP-dependent aminotransferase family protein [Anaerolineae bacterium]